MSLFLRTFFAILVLVAQVWATSNKLLTVNLKNDALALEFSSILNKSDIKTNTLENPNDKNSYRQFFDFKAVLVTKPASYKQNQIAKELKISQFDKDTVRVVALLDRKDKLSVIVDGKSVKILNESVQKSKNLPVQKPKDEKVEIKKESINPLSELNLEQDKFAVQKIVQPEQVKQEAKQDVKERKKLVVLDPGHGGKDPGAIGIDSRNEKSVVFSLALIVKEILEKRGYEVLLTRDGDYFVELQDRTRFANSKGADIFVSIHANAVDFKHSDPGKAKGIETFFLSPARSDRAKRAAEKENGANMDVMDNLTKGAFLNILNREKIVASNKLAIDIHKYVLGNLRTKFKDSVDGGVREAPFWVLVGAQMPAILLEVGYITNPDEAERFDNPQFKALMAKGVADGVDNYFNKN